MKKKGIKMKLNKNMVVVTLLLLIFNSLIGCDNKTEYLAEDSAEEKGDRRLRKINPHFPVSAGNGQGNCRNDRSIFKIKEC